MRRRTARRAWCALVLLLGATACRDDTVRVTFRPDVGAVYRYEVTVRSRSEVRLPGEEPQVRTEEVVLQSEHTVIAAGRDGVRVRVILADAAGSVRTFVVRFDRAAQLESVESEDGNGAATEAGTDEPEDAGTFGISEIFPAAAGAPPDGPLGPGERWHIDDRVVVPGATSPARLTGEGRLAGLGVIDDEDVARLATSSVLRFSSSQQTDDGEVIALDGEQVTEQRAAHDLDDGAVRSSSSTTVGRFDLEITPPFGELRDPVRGTLSVRVTSRTVRLD
jgi:hypothetical protein